MNTSNVANSANLHETFPDDEQSALIVLIFLTRLNATLHFLKSCQSNFRAQFFSGRQRLWSRGTSEATLTKMLFGLRPLETFIVIFKGGTVNK